MARRSAAKRATEKRPESDAANLREVAGAKVTSSAPSLDRIIHERLRLGIVSALAANETLTFNDLKSLLDTTDGNLSVHARKLEEAGFITCTKYFEGRTPKTEYKLSAAGRKALDDYLSHMEKLIQQMRAT